LIGNWGFIYKREIKKLSDLSEEGKTETAGMKTRAALFGMTYTTWKERQTKGSLAEPTQPEQQKIDPTLPGSKNFDPPPYLISLLTHTIKSTGIVNYPNIYRPGPMSRY